MTLIKMIARASGRVLNFKYRLRSRRYARCDQARVCVGQWDATLIQNRYLTIRDWAFAFHVLINRYCLKKQSVTFYIIVSV